MADSLKFDGDFIDMAMSLHRRRQELRTARRAGWLIKCCREVIAEEETDATNRRRNAMENEESRGEI
jgi:hypothetical protein